MSRCYIVLLVAVSLLSVTLARYEDCENPPAVKHASIQVEDDEDSVHAIYSCPHGFELSGSKELICNLDTDEWNTDPPSCVKSSEVSNEVEPENQRKKKPQDIAENRKVSTQMAATLDMSCVQAKVKAPEIRYGYVQKYDRQRSGEHVYLVAFYACNDHFEFEDSEITEVYCSDRKWVGELPVCINLGEYGEEEEEEEEYDDYEPVDEEDIDEEDDDNNGRNREATQLPATPNPTQSTTNQQEADELSNEIEPVVAEHHETPQHSVTTNEIEARVSYETATDINTIVEPTHDPYTPRVLDQECGADKGGCEHKCDRLLFPDENEPRLKCSCFDGFSLDPYDYSRCHDIDECQANNGGCEQICNNLPGSFQCSCEAGLQIDTLTGHTCVDINECELPEISAQCSGGCENTHGSFRCMPVLNSRENAMEEADVENELESKTCPPGYQVAANHECIDIDECAAGTSDCENCLNTAGAYECTCPTGYSLGEDGKICVDINECDIILEDENSNDGVPYTICPQGCVNTPGSYVCTCSPHEHLLDDRRTCVPDSCQDLNNPTLEKMRCAYQCQDIAGGGYTCVCPAGYTLHADGHNCEVAENPCTTKGGYEQCAPGSCNTNEDSTSYSCNCPAGYANDGYTCRQVDECAEGKHRCSHECANTENGYQCFCPGGYRFVEGSVEQCEDVNECQTKPDLCGALSCLNLPGSFMCVCADGSEANAETGLCETRTEDRCAQDNGGCSHMCVNQPTGASCMCPNGMQLSEDGLTCAYEDLCADNNGGCEQLCSQGRCECQRGFMLHQDGRSCIDIDECSINNGDCHHLCLNREGSYECACDVGFELADDRRTCIDVDECAQRRHDCSHECVNLAGGYECMCPQGYILGENKATCEQASPMPVECPMGSLLAGDGLSCLPQNSCLLQNGGCSHSCDEIAGCSCPAGLQLSSNDKTCEDIDECLLNNGGCSHLCVNSMGSYDCACHDGAALINATNCAVACPIGYTNSPTDPSSCIDIDECATPGICQFSCQNNNGSYDCVCPEGYALRNGRECEDVDECLTNNGGCKGGTKCINHNGSYQCRCLTGYRLSADRHTCEPRTEVRDQCSPFVAPLNGEIHCTKFRHKKKMFYNTRCKVWCNQGYRLQGPALRHCGASGQWDQYENQCLPIVCPRIPTPLNGIIMPATCSLGKTYMGERCRLQCHSGFVPIDKTVAVCTANQQWSTNATLDCAPRKLAPLPAAPSLLPSSSVSNTFMHTPETTRTTPARPHFGFSSNGNVATKRPFIKCPRNTTVFLANGEMTAHIILQKPVTNLDFRYIESYPEWTKQLQAHLAAGTYVITFRGQDPATGRRARCQTVINVRRVEPPKVIFCTPSFEVMLSENQVYRSIVWEEPRFEGEASKGLKKTYKSRIPGELFGAGVHTIYYEATNEEGLTSRCEFKIVVKTAGSIQVPSMPLIDYGYSQNTQTHQPVMPQMNYAMTTHTTQMARTQLLAGHESFIICPGQSPVKVTQTESVNLPIGCILKNVRKRPMRQRVHHQRLFNSLWSPYMRF